MSDGLWSDISAVLAEHGRITILDLERLRPEVRKLMTVATPGDTWAVAIVEGGLYSCAPTLAAAIWKARRELGVAVP